MGPFIPRSRKSRLAITAAAIAILAAGVAPASAKQAGVASAVNENAVTLPPQQTERVLVVGHNVVFDEKVTTLDRGQAQLLMLDQSAVTVAPNSELIIDRFVYDPEKRSGEMALNLSRGLMRFVGGRLSKTGSVKVRTPVATMGIRGGIALFNVISKTVVDVTLLYGDAIEGETNKGETFTLRRHGYFTRIDAEKGASPPRPISSLQGPAQGGGQGGQGGGQQGGDGQQQGDGQSGDGGQESGPTLQRAIRIDEGATIAEALLLLQGRTGASGGASVIPTEPAAILTIGATVPPVQQTPTINIGTNAGVQPPIGQQNPATQISDDNNQNQADPIDIAPQDSGGPLPDDGGGDNGGGDGPQIVLNTLYGVSAVRQGGQEFNVLLEASEIQNDSLSLGRGGLGGLDPFLGAGVDPGQFNDGDNLIIATADNNQSLASLDMAPLSFSLDGTGDPDAVPNIFNPSDMTLYVSPDTFNMGAFDAIRARNESGPNYVFYDFTSPDFDGVNGSRFTMFGGVGVFTVPDGRSFFEPTGDSQTSSLLPFSDIGRFQLLINGIGPGGMRDIDAVNITQTPIMVDWDTGKVLYLGGVFQDLRQDEPGGEMVYGAQVFVGNVTDPAGGNPATITGAHGGNSHRILNGVETRRFTTGAGIGLPMGVLGDDSILVTIGEHAALDPVDGMAQRQDPEIVPNIQGGVERGPIPLDPQQTGIEINALFGAGLVADVDGEIEVLATDPTQPGGAGRVTIDHDAMSAATVFNLTDEADFTETFNFAAADTAYFDREHFGGVVSPTNFTAGNAPAFFFVSGAAVSNFDPCVCEFAKWGFWGGGDNAPGEVSNGVTDLNFFFAGQPTPDVDMPISGQAIYNGAAFASLLQPGDVTPAFATGDFQMQTNFTNGVSAGNMNLGPQDFTIIGNHMPGNAGLGVQYFQQGQQVGVGHGAFFGPGARDVGVTIDIDNGAGLKAGGGAVGTRQ